MILIITVTSYGEHNNPQPLGAKKLPFKLKLFELKRREIKFLHPLSLLSHISISPFPQQHYFISISISIYELLFRCSLGLFLVWCFMLHHLLPGIRLSRVSVCLGLKVANAVYFLQLYCQTQSFRRFHLNVNVNVNMFVVCAGC